MKKLVMSALVLLSGLQALQAKTNPQGIKSLKGCRPNIVFVLTDDQGMGNLSCMGNPILKKPHLDRFYEQSTRFTDYHVNPTCAPTRSAIMSGRAPFKNGVTHTIQQRERMALDTVTFPQVLQSAVYRQDASLKQAHEGAIRHLSDAASQWESYAKVATSQYKPQLFSRTHYMDWWKILEDVKNELQTIKNETPSEENKRKAMPNNSRKQFKSSTSN